MSTPDSPLVTVVIPAYRAGAYVHEALASVLAQSITDLEVLIVDDGSPSDPVPEDISDDPRVIVDRRPHNTGYAGVTNHAVTRARGRWITFVDADDRVAPEYVEGLVRAGEAADADVVLAPMTFVRDGRPIGVSAWNPPGPVSDADQALRALAGDRIVGCQHILFRRPVADSPLGLTYADWVFVLRQVARAERVAYVDAPRYLYTIQEDSESGGLKPSVWDLARVPVMVQPLLIESLGEQEGQWVGAQLRRLTISHILHKAAREPRPTPLRREVIRWCRRRMDARGVLALLREGHRAAAASWVLAMISPELHGRAYRLYDRRKGRGSDAVVEAVTSP